jgi:hypothetical protein
MWRGETEEIQIIYVEFDLRYILYIKYRGLGGTNPSVTWGHAVWPVCVDIGEG